MSDTPRTDERTFDVVVKRGDAHIGRENYRDGSGDFVESDFCKKLERELNAAKYRIKRLEEVGDEVVINYVNSLSAFEMWRKAKEAKP